MSRPPTAELLDLAPHPEGGWFKETWRSPITFNPSGYPGSRSTGTAIFFLLMPGEFSRWHVVRSDELWFWHSGGPLRLRFGGTGAEPSTSAELLLGNDLSAGHQPQILIPGNTWQSAEPASDQEVLVSCVVSPGFDFDDFILIPETVLPSD